MMFLCHWLSPGHDARNAACTDTREWSGIDTYVVAEREIENETFILPAQHHTTFVVD